MSDWTMQHIGSWQSMQWEFVIKFCYSYSDVFYWFLFSITFLHASTVEAHWLGFERLVNINRLSKVQSVLARLFLFGCKWNWKLWQDIDWGNLLLKIVTSQSLKISWFICPFVWLMCFDTSFTYSLNVYDGVFEREKP